MKKFRWIVIQAAIIASAVLGFYFNEQGAQNVIQFYCWLCFVVSLTGLSKAARKSAQEVYKQDDHVARWLDKSADVALVFVLVWNGWMWTASALFISIIFLTMLIEIKDDEVDSTTQGNTE